MLYMSLDLVVSLLLVGRQLYKIPEVAPPTTISLVSAKQCRKVISQTGKFFLFMIHSQSEWKVMPHPWPHTGLLYATEASGQSHGRIWDIFTSPTRVPLHCQVKHSIELTLGTPFPNGPVYRHSLLENEEIKCQIQEFLQKGHIRPSSSPYGIPIVLVQKKDGTW
jgi:hypothetical protein